MYEPFKTYDCIDALCHGKHRSKYNSCYEDRQVEEAWKLIRDLPINILHRLREKLERETMGDH